jgi:hypothetical protein
MYNIFIYYIHYVTLYKFVTFLDFKIAVYCVIQLLRGKREPIETLDLSV